MPEPAPFVLLHMLGGWGREWNELANALQAQVFAPDLLGHGSRDAGPPPPIVSLEENAAHVLALPEIARLDRFRLVGTSLGGAVATCIAAHWTGRVESLTLISTAFTSATPTDRLAEAETASRGRDYDDEDRPLPRSLADVQKSFGITSAAAHDDIERSRTAAGRWIKPSWRGVAQADLLDMLAQVQAPVMLIYGENDTYRRFEATARERLPDARTVIAPCEGSFPHRGCAAFVASVLDQA